MISEQQSLDNAISLLSGDLNYDNVAEARKILKDLREHCIDEEKWKDQHYTAFTKWLNEPQQEPNQTLKDAATQYQEWNPSVQAEECVVLKTEPRNTSERLLGRGLEGNVPISTLSVPEAVKARGRLENR